MPESASSRDDDARAVIQARLGALDVDVSDDGDDRWSFPIEVEPHAWTFRLWWYGDRTQLVGRSVLPFELPPDRTDAIERFATLANYGLLFGNFEIDLVNQLVLFKTVVDTGGQPLTDALLTPVVLGNIMTTGRYLGGVSAVCDGESPDVVIADIEG